MAISNKSLDFAYKYPFSNEAKDVVKSLEAKEIEEKFLTAGLLRVNEALSKDKIAFVPTNYDDLKITYVMSYVYARMLVSAVNDTSVIRKYAEAESERSYDALTADTVENAFLVSKELGMNAEIRNGIFCMRFEDFIAVSYESGGLELVNMPLKNGTVYIRKDRFLPLLRRAMELKVLNGLPIERKELPSQIIASAKGIHLEPILKRINGKGTYAWIEKLLSTPIPDVRHRTVNLVLAPYLTNVVGLDAEKASKAITEYIEKCKKLNPNTRINEQYITYQCKYAKAKGMRPLSLSRARELYKGIIEFE